MSHLRIFLVTLAVVLLAGQVLADECHECHKSREFKVTHPLLYNYNQDFEMSIHGVAELACTDCHGGKTGTTNMDKAHRDVLEPVRYDNIPDTCGACHESQHDAFVTSNHHSLLKEDGSAPNCVTCHGAMDMDFIFASRVKNTCQFCHNYETGILPGVPDQADFIIGKINIIKGYKGYVELHAQDRELVAALATAYNDLTAKWHRFELTEVEKETKALLGSYRQAKAQAVKDRKAAKKAERN